MIPFTLGKMKGLTFMQYDEYRTAVATYNRVETYNSNVSTIHGQSIRARDVQGATGSTGPTGPSDYDNRNVLAKYYEFKNYEEYSKYDLGLMLLIQNNPGTKIIPVQKN